MENEFQTDWSSVIYAGNILIVEYVGQFFD